MSTSSIKADFPCSLDKLWNLVTSLEDYSWRSDLDRIEIISPTRFVEYTKTGYSTVFTITAMETPRRWEFDMENNNISGHWTGIFTFENGRAAIEFTENVTAKKLIMRPFIKAYLKKQQSAYVSDLKRALAC